MRIGLRIIGLVLKELVSIPSPTGNTYEVIAYTESLLKEWGVSSYRNRKGGLFVTIPGRDDKKHRLLTAHVDTLGAMVKEIKADGRLKIDLIGGFRYNSIEGEYCEIQTSSGKTYTGTILMHQTSVHVYKDAGKAERNQENMEVRLDEPVRTKEETSDLGIRVGDFISFDPRVQITPSGFIKSRHLDDKASVALLLNLIRIKFRSRATLALSSRCRDLIKPLGVICTRGSNEMKSPTLMPRSDVSSFVRTGSSRRTSIFS